MAGSEICILHVTGLVTKIHMKRKASEANDSRSERAAEFAAHLQALNTQYAAWVWNQAAEHSSELWTDGARAYAQYAEELTKDYEDVLEAAGEGHVDKRSAGASPLGFAGVSSSTPGSAAPASTAGLFNFASSSAAPSGAFTFGGGAPGAAPPSSAASGGTFTFGGSPGSSGTPAAGFTLSTPAASGSSPAGTPGTATAPIFAFGGTQSTAGHTPAPAKFSFGATLTTPSPSPTLPGGFTFQPAPAAANGVAADAGGGDEAEDGEGAPKAYTPEIAVDEDTYEVLHRAKSRLMVLKRPADGGKNEWEGRGVGMLTIRRFKQGPNRKAYIYFTTESGRSLVMSSIQASTKCMRPPASAGEAGAKRVTLTLQVRDDELPPAGADAKAAPLEPKYSMRSCQFTLGSAEKADAFVKAVEEHRPSS